MLHVALALLTQLAVNEEFEPRLETLRFHVERLGTITVPDDVQAKKTAKLAMK